MRVAEDDRRLVSVGEGVSVALDRRVDEHDLGIATQKRTGPSLVTSMATDKGRSASRSRCRESSRDAQYSVGARRFRQVWVECAIVGGDQLPIGVAAYPDRLLA
jgi:hypothetical protein